MNYEIMNYISNGLIVENIKTYEIVYINESARKLLDIDPYKQINSLKEILSDDVEALHTLHQRLEQDFSEKGFSYGTIYFKTSNHVFIETNFDCTWIDEEQDLIGYVFQSATDVVGEKYLKFQEVAEFLPNGIIVMDIEPELSVTYANEEHYKILGLDESKNEFNTLLKESIYEEDKEWVMSEIYDNLHKGKDVDIEFRMKTQEHKLKWVRLFGRAKESSTGTKLFYSSLKDLSTRREINDKLHLERVLFHKITELTDEILFRLDLQTNIIHFLGNQFNILFDANPVMEDFPKCILDSNVIFEEDMFVFKDMLKCFEDGIQKLVEVRLHMPNGKLEWHHIFYNFVKSSDNTPLLVIGKLINIEKQKWLEAQAKIDLLTQFYNKIHTAIEVNKLFQNSHADEEHVLFIIDIDNFKSINDNLGHHFGDIVLHDIANDIRDCFRKNDILGRIGGDEFIVVMRDCDDQNSIDEKASLVCHRLEKIFCGHEQNYSISASIGIARYPYHGKSYEKLYQMADIALYKTKENGKNNYTQYTSDFNSNWKQGSSNMHHQARRKNDLVNNTVIATVFNLLYETKDIELSLKTILEYLGRTYHVDRCYVFQTLDGGTIYQNDYQWSKETSFIKPEEIQYVPESVLMAIFKYANEDGIYYTNNIYDIDDAGALEVLEQDEIISFFVAESLKESDQKAFFGMDDCTKKRDWTDQETRTLFHASRIIFSALTNYNIMKKLKKQIVELSHPETNETS